MSFFLTEIIQYWFDFLLDIYTKVLQANLSGYSNYPIPAVRLKVDLSLSGADLSQNIKDTACKDFDFLAAPEKLKIIQKVLSIDLSSTIPNDVALLKPTFRTSVCNMRSNIVFGVFCDRITEEIKILRSQK